MILYIILFVRWFIVFMFTQGLSTFAFDTEVGKLKGRGVSNWANGYH